MVFRIDLCRSIRLLAGAVTKLIKEKPHSIKLCFNLWQRLCQATLNGKFVFIVAMKKQPTNGLACMIECVTTRMDWINKYNDGFGYIG